MSSDITKEEFIRRFVAYVVEHAGETFDDGYSVRQYAEETAPSYWDEPGQREDGPEACAEADMSYWGEG